MPQYMYTHRERMIIVCNDDDDTASTGDDDNVHMLPTPCSSPCDTEPDQ